MQPERERERERIDTPFPSAAIGGGSRHQIQTMLPRHFQIVHLKVAGLSNVAIAKVVNCSEPTVGIVLRSPLVRVEMQRLMRDKNNGTIQHDADAFASKARMLLEENVEAAAQTQVDLLESEDDSIKLRSSGSILERVLGKVEGREISGGSSITVNIESADVRLLVTALNESKELDNAKGPEPTANRENRTTDPSEGTSDVHQAS